MQKYNEIYFFLLLLSFFLIGCGSKIRLVQPRPINLSEVQRMIVYPIKARETGVEGDIMFRLLIDENGNYVKHIIITKDSPEILVAAVEEHISKVRFTPAIQNGKAIRFWVNVPFKFHLTDDKS